MMRMGNEDMDELNDRDLVFEPQTVIRDAVREGNLMQAKT